MQFPELVLYMYNQPYFIERAVISEIDMSECCMTAKSWTICHIFTDLIRVFVYPVLVFMVGLPTMLDKNFERRY